MKGGEYNGSNDGWAENVDYDVSLYYFTKLMENGSDTSYECGYIYRGYGVNKGYKLVSELVVGCDVAGVGVSGRSLEAYASVNSGFNNYVGGFSIGNPSLHPTHGNDSGSDDGTIRV